jgi:uncharacterized glyoxalase superfamily protein PhnB
MNIPSQYLQLMPYLIVTGAESFAQFTKNVFGAIDQALHKTDEKTVMHGELRIGQAVLMYSDASEAWPEKTAALYLYVPDVNQVYEKALAQGAKVLHTPEQKEYGYAAGFADPFGNHWFVVAANSDKG